MSNYPESTDIPSHLTNWKNEPSLQDLKCDFEAAKPYHDTQVSKIDRWNNLLKVSGDAKPTKVKGRSSVQPKLIRRQAEWRYSALTEPFLGTSKLFKVSPVTFEDTNSARQTEKLLNYQFRTKLNRVKFIDDYVRSTVDEGTSITRVGWKRVTVPITEQVPVWTYYQIQTQEQLDSLQKALELKDTDPRTYTETVPPEIQAAVDYFIETQQPTVAEQTGTTEVQNEKVLINQPTAEIFNPRNVYVDPSCGGDLDKALFIAVSFETSKADLLKEGKKYKNLDKVNWENNSPITEPDHQTNTPDTFNFKGVRKKVVAYEYWGFFDIKGDGVLYPFVATWIGDVLIRMEENPFPDQKLPFVLVPYLPVKRDVYGEPDAELLEDNQNILGAVSRGMIDLLGRSANGQIGFAKGMLDPLNRRRYENGQDYEFNPNQPPQNSMVEHKYPELPQSALMMLNLQNQEAEALTGVKSFGGGLSGDAYGDVAAGIRGALDAASKREMAILRRLAKGISEIGTKIAAMNAVFLSEKETIRITNEVFETVNREDLAGNYDIEVDISTAEIDSAKSQDLAFMLQTMGPNMDFAMTQMILSEIAELKRMPDLAHKIKTFKPEPDPLDQKIKELTIAELEAKIEKTKAEAELAISRAKSAKADAAQTVVETEQQADGVQHERDLERMRAQAEGNRDSEVAKALLKPRKEGESAPNIEAAVGFNQLTRSDPRDSLAPPPLPIDTQPQINEVPQIDPSINPETI